MYGQGVESLDGGLVAVAPDGMDGEPVTVAAVGALIARSYVVTLTGLA